jgi:hypothetical protein
MGPLMAEDLAECCEAGGQSSPDVVILALRKPPSIQKICLQSLILVVSAVVEDRSRDPAVGDLHSGCFTRTDCSRVDPTAVAQEHVVNVVLDRLWEPLPQVVPISHLAGGGQSKMRAKVVPWLSLVETLVVDKTAVVER